MDETLIIGAGPSGLAAGLRLAEAGRPSRILESGDTPGGLMRSLRFGDVTVDLGRKELYARFPEVDALWSELLGDRYRPYPHRVASLYRGRLLELSGRYRGPLRGIPVHWLAAGGVGLARGWIGAALQPPRSYEAHWHGRVGPAFSRMLAQGYWEKFRGRPWSEMPPPERAANDGSPIRDAMRLAGAGGMAKQAAWRHPVGGTGQIFDALAKRYQARGGRIDYGAEVLALAPRSAGGVAITWRRNGEAGARDAPQVISSLPIEQLFGLLPARRGPGPVPVPDRAAQRAVLLVYLFLDEPPRFPHAWIEVNDTALKTGRIVNYAAFGGEMVPPGRTALCVEFFCAGDDPLLEAGAAAQADLAVAELEGAGLISRAALTGAECLRLDRTNAAASWREQQSAHRQVLFDRLVEIPSIYHVNRPGSDWASLAGMQAADAILRHDRGHFDRVADPSRRQEDGSSAA